MYESANVQSLCMCVCVYVSVCTFIIIHQSLRNFHSWFSCAALIISIKAHISESVSCIVFACNKNNIDCKQQQKEKKNWPQRKIEQLYTFYTSALYLGGYPSVSDSVWCWFFSSLALIKYNNNSAFYCFVCKIDGRFI